MVGAVGGGEYHDSLAAAEAVHEAEKLGNNALFDFSFHLSTIGGEAVDFVDENEAGGGFCGFFKEAPQATFGFSVEFAHDFRPRDGHIVDFEGLGEGTGGEGFAGAGGADHEDSFGGFEAQLPQEFGAFEGDADEFFEFLEDGLESAYGG